MKIYLYTVLVFAIFTACSKTPIVIEKVAPNTHLVKTSFEELPNFNNENYGDVLELFKNNCESKKSKKIYNLLCTDLDNIQDAKSFLFNNFTPYQIVKKDGDKEGLLTGYYEAKINGSYNKSEIYKYPVYKTPNDLIIVDLSKIYPELKKYRLRGKIDGNKLIPYSSRSETKKTGINADILCYCDSKIDRFFLEVQGSGIVSLDNNSTIFIGYANQNGHKYKSIGRYLVKHGEIELKDISLQSIKKWLKNNPDRVDEVLNYNNSMVFFQKRSKRATGALGLVLTPKRSVAIDPKYIPLGSMLYIDSNVSNKKFNKVVFAQDTGGAIKGSIRADLFVGSGTDAMQTAGELKSNLKMWLLLPKKNQAENIYE